MPAQNEEMNYQELLAHLRVTPKMATEDQHKLGVMPPGKINKAVVLRVCLSTLLMYHLVN